MYHPRGTRWFFFFFFLSSSSWTRTAHERIPTILRDYTTTNHQARPAHNYDGRRGENQARGRTRSTTTSTTSSSLLFFYVVLSLSLSCLFLSSSFSLGPLSFRSSSSSILVSCSSAASLASCKLINRYLGAFYYIYIYVRSLSLSPSSCTYTFSRKPTRVCVRASVLRSFLYIYGVHEKHATLFPTLYPTPSATRLLSQTTRG